MRKRIGKFASAVLAASLVLASVPPAVYAGEANAAQTEVVSGSELLSDGNASGTSTNNSGSTGVPGNSSVSITASSAGTGSGTVSGSSGNT